MPSASPSIATAGGASTSASWRRRPTARSFRFSPTRIRPSTGCSRNGETRRRRSCCWCRRAAFPARSHGSSACRPFRPAHRGRADRCAHTRSASSSSRVSTRYSGPLTSTSCAARIRSCARSGRRNRSSGTSIRNPTTRTCPSSTPPSRTTRTAFPTRRAIPSRDSGIHGTGTGVLDWADFWRHRPLLNQRAADWATELASVGDLAGNLVRHVAEIPKTQLK